MKQSHQKYARWTWTRRKKVAGATVRALRAGIRGTGHALGVCSYLPNCPESEAAAQRAMSKFEEEAFAQGYKIWAAWAGKFLGPVQ